MGRETRRALMVLAWYEPQQSPCLYTRDHFVIHKQLVCQERDIFFTHLQHVPILCVDNWLKKLFHERNSFKMFYISTRPQRTSSQMSWFSSPNMYVCLFSDGLLLWVLLPAVSGSLIFLWRDTFCDNRQSTLNPDYMHGFLSLFIWQRNKKNNKTANVYSMDIRNAEFSSVTPHYEKIEGDKNCLEELFYFVCEVWCVWRDGDELQRFC